MPIILLKVHKSLKIGFYYIILSFCLAVYLWVEDSEKFLLNTKEIE